MIENLKVLLDKLKRKKVNQKLPSTGTSDSRIYQQHLIINKRLKELERRQDEIVDLLSNILLDKTDYIDRAGIIKLYDLCYKWEKETSYSEHAHELRELVNKLINFQ